MTEQQVLALIAGEMRRLGLELNRVKQENEGCQGPTIGTTVIKTFPIPAAPPPAAEPSRTVADELARIRGVAWKPGDLRLGDEVQYAHSPFTQPPAESEEEVVERVAKAIAHEYYANEGYDWKHIARAALAAVKGGGGE